MSPCACSPANRPELPIGGHGEIQTETIRTTDLCTQCATIDFDAMIHGELTCEYRQEWLLIKRESVCPLCRFFAAISSRHPNSSPVDSEFRVHLDVLNPYGAFSALLTNTGAYNALEDCRVVGVASQIDDYYLPHSHAVIWPISHTPSSGSPSLFSLRHIQLDSIDYGLLSGWITYCKAHHAETCELLRGYPQNIKGLKVINCETRAVIEAPEGCEFAALSYVWGAKEMKKASRDGVLPEEVPRTIADAIQATIRLGIQYLWVDQYCIDQSDEEELQQQISVMDMVYNLASVTLVGACGEDAEFGLPGVGTKARTQQPSIYLDGRLWISCSTRIATNDIKRSKWFSRAWTYQEGLFSRRRLIFTEEQVYFECNNTRCQEMVAYDLHHVSDKMDFYTGSLFKGAFSFESRGGLDDHITECTRRNLTYQGDALNAMRGIFRAFASMPSPVRTFWGIPIDRYFSINSCWPANRKVLRSPEEKFEGYYDSAFARALCWHLDKPAPRRHEFPSWSWVGWKGQLPDSFPWAFIGLHFGNSEVLVWLEKKDGTYDRLSEDVIAKFDQVNPMAMEYTPILRIEAWVMEVDFVYVAGGFKDAEFNLFRGNNLRLEYFVLAKIGTNNPPSERHQECYWPLVLSAQVTTDDWVHRELCEERFQCIVLSLQEKIGLVVRKSGNFAERIGHMELGSSHVERNYPPRSPGRKGLMATETDDDRPRYSMFDYLPRSKKVVLLR